jgi:1-deoxy-D-xylulose-5-phosphate reductoisomerase
LPIVLNAANEIAVAGFLDGRLPFTAIPEVIAAAMDRYETASRREVRTIEDVRAVDGEARRFAAGHAQGIKSKVR